MLLIHVLILTITAGLGGFMLGLLASELETRREVEEGCQTDSQ